MKAVIIIGYCFGALCILNGVGGDLSALALGVSLLATILLGTNARGVRAHVPLFNSPQALLRRSAYGALVTATLLAAAIFVPAHPPHHKIRRHTPATPTPARPTATPRPVPTATPAPTARHARRALPGRS
jgi:hypothetical protein